MALRLVIREIPAATRNDWQASGLARIWQRQIVNIPPFSSAWRRFNKRISGEGQITSRTQSRWSSDYSPKEGLLECIEPNLEGMGRLSSLNDGFVSDIALLEFVACTVT